MYNGGNGKRKGAIVMDIHETLTRQLPLYARVLLQKGINLQKGQILVVNAPVEASKFAALLAEEAYKGGAGQVVFNWYCNAATRLRYQYETQDKFETVPQWRSAFNLDYYRKGAAFLSLISADPYTMEGIDRKKIFAWQKAFHQAVKEYSDGMMASRTNWLVAAVPGTVWAKLLYPELPEQEGMDQLWLQILDSSRCLGTDPLADWDKHLAELKSGGNGSLPSSSPLWNIPANRVRSSRWACRSTICGRAAPKAPPGASCSTPTSLRKKSIPHPRPTGWTGWSGARNPWCTTGT